MMRAKKSKKADVDRHKGLFFRTGLLLSILFVIWAFRFTTEENHTVLKAGMNWEDETIEIPPIDFKQPEKKQSKPQTAKIKEVDKKQEADDLGDLFKYEFDPYDPSLIIEVEPEKYTGPTEEIIAIPEKMPVFPGGERAMYEFLDENIVYPEMEREAGIQGTVVVYFVVEKNGSLSGIKVLGGRGNTPNMNREALRVIRMMPNWTAGVQGDRKVRVSIKIPIQYRLSY